MKKSLGVALIVLTLATSGCGESASEKAAVANINVISEAETMLHDGLFNNAHTKIKEANLGDDPAGKEVLVKAQTCMVIYQALDSLERASLDLNTDPTKSDTIQANLLLRDYKKAGSKLKAISASLDKAIGELNGTTPHDDLKKTHSDLVSVLQNVNTEVLAIKTVVDENFYLDREANKEISDSSFAQHLGVNHAVSEKLGVIYNGSSSQHRQIKTTFDAKVKNL